MAYVQDGVIEASDYNTLKASVEDIYGVGDGDIGYGQTSITLSDVAGGNIKVIESVEWTNLRNALAACVNHQGSTVSIPDTSDLAVGEVVKAYDGITTAEDIPAAISTATTNRLNADVSALSTSFDAITSTRATPWATQLQHEFSATFSTVDEARYFFNAGGNIIMRASLTGGSATPQVTAWTTLLSTMGSVSMGAYSTASNSGGTGSSIGYYDLTTTYQTIWNASYSGGLTAYSANSITIQARTTDGGAPVGSFNDNGRFLQFRVTFADAHSNVYADTVDGTFSSNVDIQRATTYLTIASPSLANIILLTAGS